MKLPDLTIITPTWQRLALLANCIRQVRDQVGQVYIEHIVVSDGPDQSARAFCEHLGVNYAETDQHFGDWGKRALDLGLSIARADYLCFWDDDNVYHADAASKLYSAAVGYDMGVCPVLVWHRVENHMYQVPRDRDAMFQIGDIDTSSACVRRRFLVESGLTPGTIATGSYEADFYLWRALQDRGARINFVESRASILHV